MSLDIASQWRERLAAGSARFVLTTDGDGLPHLEADPSIRVDGDGRIELLIADEYSATHRNLVRAVWFGRRIVIHLRDEHGALRIVGKPYKALVSGPCFEAHYRRLAACADFIGLSAVWLIDPESVEEVGAADAGRLPLIHLDRIARAA